MSEFKPYIEQLNISDDMIEKFNGQRLNIDKAHDLFKRVD